MEGKNKTRNNDANKRSRNSIKLRAKVGLKNVFLGMNISEIKLPVKEKCYESNLLDNTTILHRWTKLLHDVCHSSFLSLVQEKTIKSNLEKHISETFTAKETIKNSHNY